MKTFYDYRHLKQSDAKKYPVQGRVILKSKNFWLLWISKDSNWFLGTQKPSQGFIVAPRTIYLYNVYIASSFWDAIKYFIKVSYKQK
jgi:hypothetical protein